MRRPESLAEVADWSSDRREFEYHFADFLDQFYLERRPEMLAQEPRRLKDLINDDGVADAYLAATAASLARLSRGVSAPVGLGGGSQTQVTLVCPPRAKRKSHAPG